MASPTSKGFFNMKLHTLADIEHSHGSVHLISDNNRLQHKPGTSIVLVPQPNASDPNDPLNWSFVKRVSTFYPCVFLSTVSHFAISGLAPGFGAIAQDFHVGPDKLSWLISICMLGTFVGVYAFAPLIDRFGRRPIWLLAALWLFVCSIWAAVAQSFTSLLLARFFGSITAGISEPVSVSTVNDLFFLHERGTQCGVQSIWLSMGASVSPVITGFLIQSKGWRWYNWLLTILAGFDLVWMFFCSPETRYKRNLHLAIDVAGADEYLDGPNGTDNSVAKIEISQAESTELEERSAAPPLSSKTIQKRMYLQELKPWSPLVNDVNELAAFLRAWATWSYLSVAWVVMAWAVHVATVIVLISLIPLYLGAPPYNFTASQQGLTFIAAVIGNIFGSLSCGWASDTLIKWSSRRNNGVYEPEMRLPLALIPTVLCPTGLLMFGLGIDRHLHWIVPVIGSGLVSIGLTGIASVGQSYILDSYAPVANDCVVNMYGFKCLVAFAIGFAVIPWLEANGLVAVFCILAAMVLVLDGCVIGLLVWGKRLRERDAHLRIIPF